MSNAKKGKPGPNKGKTFTKEHRQHLRESHQGKQFTKEHIQHLRESHQKNHGPRIIKNNKDFKQQGENK